MTVKSASYKFDLPTIIEISPPPPLPRTKLCETFKQKIINPNPIAGENNQKGVGGREGMMYICIPIS